MTTSRFVKPKAEASHLIKLSHNFRLQLIKSVKVLVFYHLVPINSVGLMEVNLHQVLRCLDALTFTEENALKWRKYAKSLCTTLRTGLSVLICSLDAVEKKYKRRNEEFIMKSCTILEDSRSVFRPNAERTKTIMLTRV